MIIRNSETSVTLCCAKKGCPVVTKLDEDTYEVTDDFGKKIIVKKAELKLMADAVTVLDQKEQLLCG